jgi:hypothetical protein
MRGRVVVTGRLTRSMIAFLILALGGISLVSCSADSRTTIAATCVPPSAFDALSTGRQYFNGGMRGAGWVQVWKSAVVHVVRGTFVGLELIEPEYPAGYVGSRAGFPWTRPTLSGAGVLKPARRCRTTPTSGGLPVVTYYFQSVASGTVTATAPLSEGWRVQSVEACQEVRISCAPLKALRVTVTVS